MNIEWIQNALAGLAAGIAGAGTGAALILSAFLVPLMFKHLDHSRADRITRLFLSSSGPLIGIAFWVAGALALLGFAPAAGISLIAIGFLFALAGLAAFPKTKRRTPGVRRDFATQRRVAQMMTFLLTPIAMVAVTLAAMRV